MREISLAEMLKCGVHFGHKAAKRHPKMAPFIFTQKNGIHILDLEQTKIGLEKALAVAKDLASQQRTILFVGTKKQAKDIVEKYAKACQMPYIIGRWTGGLLTNFACVSRLMKELKRLKKGKVSGEFALKYTKKEQLEFEKETARLEKLVGGIEELKKLPDALFLIDTKEDKTAVSEAKKKGVPIIAIVDTNNNPEAVSYPIPANDDAIKSIDYITKLMSEAVLEGREIALKNIKPEVKI